MELEVKWSFFATNNACERLEGKQERWRKELPSPLPSKTGGVRKS